jgi:hypothetical protein
MATVDVSYVPGEAVHRGAFDPMAPWRQWQDLRHAR